MMMRRKIFRTALLLGVLVAGVFASVAVARPDGGKWYPTTQTCTTIVSTIYRTITETTTQPGTTVTVTTPAVTVGGQTVTSPPVTTTVHDSTTVTSTVHDVVTTPAPPPVTVTSPPVTTTVTTPAPPAVTVTITTPGKTRLIVRMKIVHVHDKFWLCISSGRWWVGGFTGHCYAPGEG